MFVFKLNGETIKMIEVNNGITERPQACYLSMQELSEVTVVP